MNILGIDVGGTKILGVRADEHGSVLDKLEAPTEAAEGVEAVIGRIVAIIGKLTPPEGVDAIGIGMPGPLDAVRGIVYDPPNLPGWQAVPLYDKLKERLSNPKSKIQNPKSKLPPIILVNDANAAALAEYTFGAGSEKKLGRKIRHLVYLTISTGVGGGVIANGRLLLGANGYAAELGHIIIDAHGKRCNCGNVGCLEAMASGTALAKEAAIVTISHHPSKIRELAGGDPDKATARIVAEAARQGDRVALELMAEEAFLVGVGVATCIHAFNPELVVLGGGVMASADLLLDPIRATVEKKVIPAYLGTYEIVTVALKGESGALGAVAAALEGVKRKT